MKKLNSSSTFIFILIFIIVFLILISPKSDFLIDLVGELFLLLIAVILIFALNNKKILIPINLKKLNSKIILYAFIISLANSILSISIICIMEFLKIGDSSIVNSNVDISPVIAVIIGPICEELLFRVAILGLFSKKFSIHISIIIQAFIFAFVHCFTLTSITFYFTFMCGVIYGYLFFYTKSVLPSILCHAVDNTIATLSENSTLVTNNIRIFVICILGEVISLLIIIYLVKKIKTRTLKE